jgi:hypothetical protein
VAVPVVGVVRNSGVAGILVAAVLCALGAGLLWYLRSDGADPEPDERASVEARADTGGHSPGTPSPTTGPGDLDRLRAGVVAWRRPVAVVIGTTVLLTVAAAALPADGTVGEALLYGGVALPVLALVAQGWLWGAGRQDGRAREYRRLLALAVLVGPWLAGLGQVLGRPPQDLGVVILVLTWAASAIVVGAVGHRLALVAGRRVAGRAEPEG